MTDKAVPGPVRDLVGYNGKPPKVTWPGGARIAISLVVNYEEGSELAIGDGDTTREPDSHAYGSQDVTRRDIALEGMYEYGARAGFWRLMDIFDEHDVKCTFYACAVALERNLHAAAIMRPKGHDVISHGYRWEDVTLLTREQEREHIRLAVESIAKTTGERPVGWYCRRGPSVNTRDLLVEEGGFLYDSDSYADDLPYWTQVNGKKHLVVPYSLASNDGKFDGPWFGSPVDFEQHLKEDFDRLYKEGETDPKMMNIGLHLRITGHPGRAHALSNFIGYARSFPGVWFARRIEIARHWIEHHP